METAALATTDEVACAPGIDASRAATKFEARGV
jgi:hypothetical protein